MDFGSRCGGRSEGDTNVGGNGDGMRSPAAERPYGLLVVDVLRWSAS